MGDRSAEFDLRGCGGHGEGDRVGEEESGYVAVSSKADSTE